MNYFSMEEILNQFKMDAQAVYEPFGDVDKTDTHKKNVLVIVPDLGIGGALIVLLEMLENFQKLNYQIYVVSPEDGKFKDSFLKMGIPVIIRPYVVCKMEYRIFLQEYFQLVFVNSAICHAYIMYFLNVKVKVLWWLHETKAQLSTVRGLPDLRLLSSNIQMAGVTKNVTQGIKESYGLDIPVLHMGIKDCLKPEIKQRINNNSDSTKVRFFMPASFSIIKGQDILIQAIMLLPKEFQEKSEFIFCGYQLDGQQEYGAKIREMANRCSNITMLEELTKEEVYQKYRESDCIVAPSRIDATPTTIVEAMMFEKLCLCSDATGISGYMIDCVNGFVFKSEDVQELLKRILLIIDSIAALEYIAKAGRKIYEQQFSQDAVGKQLELLLSAETD